VLRRESQQQQAAAGAQRRERLLLRLRIADGLDRDVRAATGLGAHALRGVALARVDRQRGAERLRERELARIDVDRDDARADERRDLDHVQAEAAAADDDDGLAALDLRSARDAV